MFLKEINPPEFLHDIHGSTTTVLDVMLSYLGGVIAMGSVYVLYMQHHVDLSLWKLILLLVISADIGAGAVANFTKGTNAYYSGDSKKKTRLGFILIHFLHPTVFFFTLDLFSWYTIGLVLGIVITTLLINAIKTYEIQKTLAAFALVLGISMLFILNVSNPFLLWFFPLFMIKLFIAFGIRRYNP
ncbi:MAG: hypothetical protein ACRBFS_02540 [Aureispira sp.]